MELVEDLDDVTLKVIVVGNGRVGKTSMTTRYCQGVFTGAYKKTIGVDFMEKRIRVLPSGEAVPGGGDDADDDGGEAVTLMIWDTAGQEEFDQLTSRYYRGAGAVVYAFSTVDRDSFEAIPRWMEKVKEECGDIASVLVQNKMDLVEEAVVDREEVRALARRLDLPLFRTSVADDYNIAALFETLAADYLRADRSQQTDGPVMAIEALAGALSGSGPSSAPASAEKKKKNKHKNQSPARRSPQKGAGAAAAPAKEDGEELRSRYELTPSDPHAPADGKTVSKRRAAAAGAEPGCVVQ